MVHSDKSSIQIHEAIHDIYSLDDVPGIDRIYHVKARLLNDAIQDIGMGRYQVCPWPCSTQRTILIRFPHAVDAFLSCRFRMVRR
jgi:hypothetical protein